MPHVDGLDTDRVWPDGWTVHPDPAAPSRGTLVKGSCADDVAHALALMLAP